MTTEYIGIIDGVHTWQVRDENGNIIGFNQTIIEDNIVPNSISARQIRLWLIRNNISLESVER
ncbi:hypothetical protein EBZ38_02970 [bacterium]|nr:hypothetical protein [bacterium]